MNRLTSLYRRAALHRKSGLAMLAAGTLLLAVLWPSPEESDISPLPVAPSQFLEPDDVFWSCSMHPHVHQHEPGQCPICGMDLVQVKPESTSDASTPAHLELSQATRARMGVRTHAVQRRFAVRELQLSGRVAHDETRLAHISAWAPGRIDDLYVDFTGVRVEKGQHMVRLYSPDLYAAQEELIQANETYDKRLESGLSSALDSARLTREAAREKLARLGMSETHIRTVEESGQASAHVTIHAPIGGVVIERHASEGSYLETGTRIVTIADLDHLWVQLDAYESDLAWIRYTQAVTFETQALPGRVFQGTVVFIDPTLDATSRTARVRVHVDNTEGLLKPEMLVRASISSHFSTRFASGGKVLDKRLAGKWISPMHPEVVKDAPGHCDVCGMALVRAESLASPYEDHAQEPLVIPVEAALLTGKRAIVHVEELRDGVPTYEAREVVLGPRAGDVYIVESGLEEGDLVVVSGNFQIDSALQIKALPSMMQGHTASGGHHHAH